MFKVTVQNEVNSMSFEAKFETQESARAWVDKQIAKKSWGSPQRKMWKDECNETLLARILSEKSIVTRKYVPAQNVEVFASYDEDGVGIGEPIQIIEIAEIPKITRIEVELKADYVVSIEDISEEYKLRELRKSRDRFLSATDKFMLVDFPIDEATKQKYMEYRTYLRDLPDLAELPESVLSFVEWDQ